VQGLWIPSSAQEKKVIIAIKTVDQNTMEYPSHTSSGYVHVWDCGSHHRLLIGNYSCPITGAEPHAKDQG
jgi:hypothetical protein